MKEASETVGLGPIDINVVIGYYQAGTNGSDLHQYTTKEVTEGSLHNDARILAVKDLLSGELNFEDDEIEIVETKFATDLEKQLVWCKMRNKGMVARIFARNAKMMNREIKIVQKYPSQAWRRLKAIENIIKSQRNRDSNARYQIRVGYDDLQVMYKQKGEIFQPISLHDLTDGEELPPLDYFSPAPRGRKGPPPPKSSHQLTPPTRDSKRSKEEDATPTPDDLDVDDPSNNKDDASKEKAQKDAGLSKGSEELEESNENKDAKLPPAT